MQLDPGKSRVLEVKSMGIETPNGEGAGAGGRKVRLDDDGGLERNDSSIPPTTITNKLPLVNSLFAAARSSHRRRG